MSWLLVAFVPALLMLAAFSLGRLESRLGRDSLKAADVDEFLAQARPSDVSTLARDGMPEALDCFQRRRLLANHAGPNPQFRPTRRADSV